MKIKKCFIDTETTGTDTSKHSIHQLASIMMDENGKCIDYILLTFRPFKTDDVENSALEVVGTTYEKLMSREMTSGRAFLKFQDYLNKHVNRFDKQDKLQFMAYNSEFDERFVREWFAEHDDSFYGAYFWHPSVCIMKAAAWLLRDNREVVPNFKLETLCKFAKIDFNTEEAHSALYDIKKTIELYKALE